MELTKKIQILCKLILKGGQLLRFLPFSAMYGPNLTFSRKWRWLDINLSYFHAKFQQKMIKIEVTRAKKRRTKPKLRIHMPIN